MTRKHAALDAFHPATRAWFGTRLGAPSPIQAQGWPAIRAGGHVLLAAPTGSGKTLAAFLHAIDALMVQALGGALPDQVQVVYISPLKALSYDVQTNLAGPLEGIAAALAARGLTAPPLRVACRTGDTPAAERARMLKKPPHVLVTTPESLYLLLTTASGQNFLRHARTVIVDEIHALAPSRRGSHLALSLEHLADVCDQPLQRIGLSATQKPMDEVARFLVGKGHIDADGRPACTLVDVTRALNVDIALALPMHALEAIMSTEVWHEVYAQLEALIAEHTTTLIFVNTRRMAEKLAFVLAERLGEGTIVAHHGSLAPAVRHEAEQRLKRGDLKALVATGSLELGIDMGPVDLVCQVGSVRQISTFIQRVGRANHHAGGVPKGYLFPLTRDELVECTALIMAVRQGELDTLVIPPEPLDILAQQLVARVSAQPEVSTPIATLWAWARRAYPYRNLSHDQFMAVLRMVAEGYATRRGRRGTLLHLDVVQQEVRPRKGARLAALTCGGAIADTGDFRVVLMPEEVVVGHVNEDFAVDSHVGDVFVLGTMHWRILGVRGDRVNVEDAGDCPPSMPFWFGEAPSRSPELSAAVSALRRRVATALDDPTPLIESLCQDSALPRAAMTQLVGYLHATQRALGQMPHDGCLVAERFFDDAGGMQMVLHCPLGSRLNRAFGLALRKRFCKSFNFELQAAATEDAIVLSLGEVHSFPLADVFSFLHANTVRHVLIQALLDAPMFQLRWRHNAGRSLAVLRMWAGQRVAPQVLRMQAEDLVAAVFPDQIACLENIQGERRVPDHPLVKQTIDDCLHEAMDVDALEALLVRLANGSLPFVAVDTPEPSVACHEILVARPYAFLDDGDAEERRTQAVYLRRDLRGPNEPGEQGRISPEALARVTQLAWPKADTPDEVHDALTTMVWGVGTLVSSRAAHWAPHLAVLETQQRVVRVPLGAHGHAWVCTELLPTYKALFGAPEKPLDLGARAREVAAQLAPTTAEAAAQRVVAGMMQVLGPVTASELEGYLALAEDTVDAALLGLEREGFVLRGAFRTVALRADIKPEWCERRLLARMHRETVRGRRQRVKPVSQAVFQHFLWHWHRLVGETRREGLAGLTEVLDQLAGLELPARAWESDILPARVRALPADGLEQLCMTGEMGWGRITQPTAATAPRKPLATSPLAVMRRADAWAFRRPATDDAQLAEPATDAARRVLALLGQKGALFTLEIARGTDLEMPQVACALAELGALGLVASDSYAGLRALLAAPCRDAVQQKSMYRRHRAAHAIERAGRWSLSAATLPSLGQDASRCMAVRLRALLARWGVVTRSLLAKESTLYAWGDLVRLLRRMEMRGEVLGGYFIEGIDGEQFADPKAVPLMARLRDARAPGRLGMLSAADPLNLTGILGDGPRVPRIRKYRLVCRDGVPIAYWGKQKLHRLKPDAATDYELLSFIAESQTQKMAPRQGA